MGEALETGFGVLGSGAMARAYCECLTRYTHGARLVAIGGGSRAPALAADYRVAVADSAGGVLALPDVDAVIIATPEMYHEELTIAAATHGRHVLVEKPMAVQVHACDAMIAACANAAVQLMVVKHWRFRGAHIRARKRLEAGGLGRILHVRNTSLSSLYESLATIRRKPFYQDPSGGGLLMGWAVHNFDWVCHLMGAEPVDIHPLAPGRSHPALGATHLEVLLRFADGATAEVNVAIDLPKPPPRDRTFRTEVLTERGQLDVDGYGCLRETLNGKEARTLWTQPAFDPRDPVDPRRLEAFADMLQAFIDAIRSGREVPVTGAHGRRAVKLYHAALVAVQSGVDIALQDRGVDVYPFYRDDL